VACSFKHLNYILPSTMYFYFLVDVSFQTYSKSYNFINSSLLACGVNSTLNVLVLLTNSETKAKNAVNVLIWF
jgi:hypothetical protein